MCSESKAADEVWVVLVCFRNPIFHSVIQDTTCSQQLQFDFEFSTQIDSGICIWIAHT